MPFGLETRDILTILSMAVTLWWFDRRRVQQQALRDQKIDIILKGVDGQNGLIGNVNVLEYEMFDYKGSVPRLRHHLSSVRTALAVKGIDTPEQ